MLERNKNLEKVKVDPQLTSSPPQVVLVGAGGAVVDMNLGWNYTYSQTRLFIHLFLHRVLLYIVKRGLFNHIVLTFSL